MNTNFETVEVTRSEYYIIKMVDDHGDLYFFTDRDEPIMILAAHIYYEPLKKWGAPPYDYLGMLRIHYPDCQVNIVKVNEVINVD
jgi:hypothetical protein